MRTLKAGDAGGGLDGRSTRMACAISRATMVRHRRRDCANADCYYPTEVLERWGWLSTANVDLARDKDCAIVRIKREPQCDPAHELLESVLASTSRATNQIQISSRSRNQASDVRPVLLKDAGSNPLHSQQLGLISRCSRSDIKQRAITKNPKCGDPPAPGLT